MKKNRPRERRPKIQRDINYLVALGYLKEVKTGVYILTPKGKAYIEDMLGGDDGHSA